MGKFRSKLKRNQKGKSWARGQSSTSNPENMKHRMKAKSRFFQPNLSLVPPPDPNEKPSSLTLKAVYEHEARQGFMNGGKEPTVEELDLSLKSFSLDDDLMSASGLDTFKTQQTFASNYSACTNQSFSKLMNTFRANSEAHREMLAVLTAMKQVITERNGKETTTEYFLLLMETIDNAQDSSKTASCLSLLAMCIKSVPTTVLRETFSNSVETLLGLLEQFMEQEDYNSVRNTIRSLCVLLRAQPYTSWTYSSTTKCVTILLQLLLHSKPKIRKSAHNAIVAIVNGSCFMKPQSTEENKEGEEDENESETQIAQEEKPTAQTHPADECIVKFCIGQFESFASAKSSKNLLHCLELLKEIVNTFKADQIRAISEMILSILTTGEVLIRAKSFEVLYRLFVSKNKNLNGNMCGKLLSAIYDNRPDKENVSETLRWITVLREAYVHLASVDLRLCVECLPEFLVICIRDMLPSEKHAAVTAFTLKTVLDNCVKPCCESEESSHIHRSAVLKLIKFVHKGLTSHTWNTDYMKYITLICARLFEAVGKHFSDDVKDIIVILGEQYDTQSPYRIPIEHAVLSAVKYLGPEKTLEAIPITNAKDEVRIERSWLLPILREGIQESSVTFFSNHILKLANDCYDKWQALKNKDITWHSYELLFCQLWGLFPGCCRKVTDIENFKTIAKKLGMTLNNNPEVRAPILDGFKQLIENKNEECNSVLSRYAKNMLPCLFNIYVAKPNGTYEADIRKKTLDVIKDYLTVAPKEVYEELFKTGTDQLMTPSTEPFVKDAIFDILSLIIVVHDSKALKKFFKDFIVPILQNKKVKIFAKDDQRIQKLQRKTYCLLEQIMSSESVECQKFRKKNFSEIKNLLLGSLKSSCLISQASRLKCLKLLLESSPDSSIDDDLIVKTIPEILINFKNFSVKSEDIALQLLKLIGNRYKDAGKLDTFIDEVMSGMASDQLLVTNTILALGQILQNLSGSLTVTTIQFVLDQILILLVQKQRGQAEASVKFLLIFIKVLPTPLVANHLEVILKSLSAMVPDTKRYCRLLIGYMLKKLCKRFGAEECIKLVPGNDEVTHRRLKKIRKDLNREKRRKLESGKDDDDEDEEEVLEGLQAKSATIDDVLDDSDSDLSDNENANDRNKNSKNKELYIQEFPEDIVDLHDMKSIGNVMTNRSAQNSAVEIGNSKLAKKKDKDPNRGFKTADDGRLIIPLDDKYKKSDSEDDDDEDDDSSLDGKDEEMKRVGNKSKRKFEEDSSDEDVDMSKAPSRKRKALDAKSVASGKSRGSQYQPGGKGIHRPVAASVKSGYTNLSKKSNKSAATTKAFGSEYKSRKAQGDMKKSGKLDPYAYIPLSRNVLNKRKRAKHAGQFRSIVRGMRKGVQKGAKSKASKAHKK